ncbi:RDD family protein [Paenibacillus sp. TH7-28]
MYDVLWRRYGALVVDRIIVAIAALILSFVWMSLQLLVSGYADTEGSGVSILLMLVCQWLYYTLLESSKHQATLGKMLAGIVVVDQNHRRISYGEANARFFGRILSAFTFGIGYLMAIFTNKKQALHDKVASTYVVNKSLLRVRELAEDAEDTRRLHQAIRADRSTDFNWPD